MKAHAYDKLFTKEQILSYTRAQRQNVGVYFLISGCSIVYVEQFEDIRTRLNGHYRKEWDRCVILGFSDARYRKVVERRYIRALNPRYNGLKTNNL